MRIFFILVSVVLHTVLLVTAATAADDFTLLPTSESDLVASELMAAQPAKSGPQVSMDRVTFCWPLSHDVQIDDRPTAHTALSREFHLLVSSAELAKGVEISISAPGALVRLNPPNPVTAGEGLAIDPQALTLIDPAGAKHSAGTGMIHLADAESVKASGAPFADGTSAFQIDPELGYGRFILQAPNMEREKPSAVAIHVFEKSSPVALSATAERPDYLQGQMLSATFRFEGLAGLELTETEVSLRSPTGETFPAVLRRTGEVEFAAEAELSRALDSQQGLWEVHATAIVRSDDLEIRRDVHTAFAIATPTARLVGRVSVDRSESLVFSFPIEVASAGRYEARALLYGTDLEGNLHPIATAHVADFVASGVATLDLEFPAGVVRSSGLTAPFELRDLQLGDQGRMSLLHRQARALVLE